MTDNANIILEQVRQISQEAGAVLMTRFGQPLTREIKSRPNDFATEADHTAEAVILLALKKHFPRDDIISEEAGVYEKAAQPAAYTWIIDPLDGTYSFANQHTNFAVMMTRAHGTQLELAVVYYPATKTVITAYRGQGTRMQGQMIRLTDNVDKPLCVERNAYASVRRAGFTSINEGASINILTTVSGHSRAYISNNGKVWDFAPAALILQEAGYTVTNFTGQAYTWNSPQQSVVAAPAELHTQLIPILKELA